MIAACVVQDGHAYWTHVGDCRFYLVRKGRILLRSRDHTVVQRLVDEGRIREEAMATHPHRNRLLQCLGGIQQPQPDWQDGVRLARDDILLLCSDGFWGPLTPRQMLHALLVQAARRGDPRAGRARRALRRARVRQRFRGGDDMGSGARLKRTAARGRAAPGAHPARLHQARRGLGAGGVRRHAVLCTASVEERVPPFLKDSGRGWVTAEYGMLPRATNTRSEREAARGKQSGRTQEIQRLIGRSLRAVVDLASLGPRTVHIDCDVLQADGGTRTAAITGAFVALHDAVSWLKAKKLFTQNPIKDHVAAVSVGMSGGAPLLDLDYAEDSACGCDMNVVMTGAGRSSKCRAPRRARRSRATSSTRCSGSRSAASRSSSQHQKRALRLVKLVLASGNPGKLREIGAILAPLSIEVVAQSALGIAEADEPHATFLENALAKARHASRAARLPALADDSGPLRRRARRRAGRGFGLLRRARGQPGATRRPQQREAACET